MQLDPITPLPAAETLAGLLGQDAVLVRQNSFGVRCPVDSRIRRSTDRWAGWKHTTVSAPSACMNEIFIAYMTNGTVSCRYYTNHRLGGSLSRTHEYASSQLPANGTVCEVDADYEIFAGINTADILANIPSTEI